MNNANNQKEKQLVGIWNKGEFSVSSQKLHFFKLPIYNKYYREWTDTLQKSAHLKGTPLLIYNVWVNMTFLSKRK